MCQIFQNDYCNHNFKLTIDYLVHIHMHVNSSFQKPHGT